MNSKVNSPVKILLGVFTALLLISSNLELLAQEICSGVNLQEKKQINETTDCSTVSDSGKFAVGATTVFNYDITNNGLINIPASKVLVSDDKIILPPVMPSNFQASTTSSVIYKGDAGNDGILSIGETWTIQVSKVLTQADANPFGVHCNKIQVKYPMSAAEASPASFTGLVEDYACFCIGDGTELRVDKYALITEPISGWSVISMPVAVGTKYDSYVDSSVCVSSPDEYQNNYQTAKDHTYSLTVVQDAMDIGFDIINPSSTEVNFTIQDTDFSSYFSSASAIQAKINSKNITCSSSGSNLCNFDPATSSFKLAPQSAMTITIIKPFFFRQSMTYHENTVTVTNLANNKISRDRIGFCVIDDAYCGDGQIDPIARNYYFEPIDKDGNVVSIAEARPEACDDGYNNGSTIYVEDSNGIGKLIQDSKCSINCTIDGGPSCGDGVLDSTEDCDYAIFGTANTEVAGAPQWTDKAKDLVPAPLAKSFAYVRQEFNQKVFDDNLLAVCNKLLKMGLVTKCDAPENDIAPLANVWCNKSCGFDHDLLIDPSSGCNPPVTNYYGSVTGEHTCCPGVDVSACACEDDCTNVYLDNSGVWHFDPKPCDPKPEPSPSRAPKEPNKTCTTQRTAGCFDPETKILMADGTSKAIKNVRAGDLVKNPVTGQDLPIELVIESAEVAPMIRLRSKVGEILVTQTHPMLTSEGLVQARNLRVGDLLVAETGDTPILQIEVLPSNDDQVVINFRVKTDSSSSDDRMVLAEGVVTGDYLVQQILAGVAK